MSPAIATATRCNCGQPVMLLELPTFALPHRWQAHCDACLDPTEDAHPFSLVVGYGTTPPEALWDWQDSHDNAWGVEWHPTPLVPDVLAQAALEFERQRGWQEHLTDRREWPTLDAILFGPASQDAAEMGTGT